MFFGDSAPPFYDINRIIGIHTYFGMFIDAIQVCIIHTGWHPVLVLVECSALCSELVYTLQSSSSPYSSSLSVGSTFAAAFLAFLLSDLCFLIDFLLFSIAG